MSMRRYEVVFVLAPQLTEEEVQGLTETFSGVAEEKGAKVLNVDDWGKRRLAFPVKKNKEGIYLILTLEEENADAVTELERRFRVSDNVIRYLTVRVDEDLKRADKFAARRNRRKDQPTQVADRTEAASPEAAPVEEKTQAAVEETSDEPDSVEEAASEEAAVEQTESSQEASAEEASDEAEAGEDKPEDAKTVEEK